ncbi:MAG: endonuclease/exonuclease/phosphatase family protein [Myxococcota bacterium]
MQLFGLLRLPWGAAFRLAVTCARERCVVAQRKSTKTRGRKNKGAADRFARDLAELARRRVSVHTRVAAAKSLSRARELSETARNAIQPETAPVPYLSLVRSFSVLEGAPKPGEYVRVASYNVHRWAGHSGRAKPDVRRARSVIEEIGADVFALQEVLHPFGEPHPLESVADELGLHLAFAVSRIHRRGELGNAILSRFPFTGVSVLDISSSRLERRGALAAQFDWAGGRFGVVATHLSLVDRTRRRQVKMLLDHPQLNAGPAVLVGDMNSWRRCKASQSLDDRLHRHNNVEWPATFPAARPILALDRIYAQNARLLNITTHDSSEAKRASDHLPVVARIRLETQQPETSGRAARGFRS